MYILHYFIKSNSTLHFLYIYCKNSYLNMTSNLVLEYRLKMILYFIILRKKNKIFYLQKKWKENIRQKNLFSYFQEMLQEISRHSYEWQLSCPKVLWEQSITYSSDPEPIFKWNNLVIILKNLRKIKFLSLYFFKRNLSKNFFFFTKKTKNK